MNALRQVLIKIWEGLELTGDDVVALCLLLAMVGSLGHLFTMLATRWGDRNIAFKSLLASLLVHCVCLLGLEVFDPLHPVAASEAASSIPSRDVTTSILVESEDQVPLNESGNTPIPDRPNAPIDLTRLPQAARLMEPPESPERQPEVLDSLEPNADDVSNVMTEATPQAAMAVDDGRVGPHIAAANDAAADVDTMLEQSNADVYVPDTERLQTKRGDIVRPEIPQPREATSGAAVRIDPDLHTEDMSLLTATSDIPGAVSVPAPDRAETVARKRSPVAAESPTEIVGLTSRAERVRTVPARSFESRLPRPSRTIRSPDPGARPVRENSLTPQTPIPLSVDYDEVRSGMTMLNVTDALETTANAVAREVPDIRRRQTRPATYKLRDIEQRRDVAEKFGGTAQSEAAVELSLRWLARMQSEDGRWDADRFGAGKVKFDEEGIDRKYAGRDADTGITALVTLSFLGAGYTHQNGKYSLHVDRALDWLIRQQDAEGSLSGAAGHYAAMYCHAMATYALAEALGMQNEFVPGPIVDPEILSATDHAALAASSCLNMQNSLLPHLLLVTGGPAISTQSELTAYGMRKVDDLRLRSALRHAINFTISRQDPKRGGWRYVEGQEGDVSMFGWQMMSLKSAEIAGISIPRAVRQRMVLFIDTVRQGKNGGLFGYRRSVREQPQPITPVMTAEALFCQQMLGYPRDSPASEEAIRYMRDNLPRLSEINLYYWYYGTLAMYQYGGEAWTEWNSATRDTLISHQRRDGRFAGSWDPDGPWGRYGGRLYSTALSTLTLEVYYRLLPLYRITGDRRDGENR